MIENGHKQPSHDIVDRYERILGFENGQINQMFQLQHVSEKVDIAMEQLPLSQSHLDILCQGIDVWNQWREEHLNIRPSLDRADLEMANLCGANLNGADLTLAKLIGANLRDADLSNAVLRQAFLIDVDLRDANLHRVYLSEANLSRANLSRANLSRANLSRANLSRADLSSADLSSADLSSADLKGANLSGANLSGANLSDADLNMASLEVSNLTEANLTGSNLDSTDLSRATVINTIFGNVDLRDVRGLDTLKHNGPSTIGIDTIMRSEANIPTVFVRGAGVPDVFIEYMRSFSNKAMEYYTCFISYSSQNQEFAEKLYSDLTARGVRCWYAPEDLKIGDKFPTRIDEAIRVHDKLLLVLSDDSINSQWVGVEVEAALERERSQNKLILFPIKLDNAIMQTNQAWAADIRRIRSIADFSQWKQQSVYQKELNRLLSTLHIKSNSATLNIRGFVAEVVVAKWLEDLGYRPEHDKEMRYRPEHDKEMRYRPDMFVIDKDGNSIGVEVKSYSDFNSVRSQTRKLYQVLREC